MLQTFAISQGTSDTTILLSKEKDTLRMSFGFKKISKNWRWKIRYFNKAEVTRCLGTKGKGNHWVDMGVVVTCNASRFEVHPSIPEHQSVFELKESAITHLIAQFALSIKEDKK